MNMELFKKKVNNKNKILIIAVILIFGISIFLVINKNNIFKSKKLALNDKTIIEKINVDSNINEITVIDARIEKLNTISNIFIKMKNNTDNEIDKTDLKLTIYDKDNNIVLVSIINNVEKFNIGLEREIQLATNNDISKASKYIIEKN